MVAHEIFPIIHALPPNGWCLLSVKMMMIVHLFNGMDKHRHCSDHDDAWAQIRVVHRGWALFVFGEQILF